MIWKDFFKWAKFVFVVWLVLIIITLVLIVLTRAPQQGAFIYQIN